MRQDLLNPLVIVLIPRLSEVVPTLFETLVPKFPNCRVIALSTSEDETSKLTRHWNTSNCGPLLIIRGKPEELGSLAVSGVVQVHLKNPTFPLAIILGDGPEVGLFHDLRRSQWNEEFASSLSSEVFDLQVVEYSASWRFSPPRFR